VLLLVELPIGAEARALPDDAPTPFAQAARAERDAILKAIVRRLGPRERRLLSLYYDADLPFARVAARWRVSEKTISKLHGQILRALRASLADRRILLLREIL
jgi:RNA polymerase sigma factor (sigma-70 family)